MLTLNKIIFQFKNNVDFKQTIFASDYTKFLSYMSGCINVIY